MTPNQKYKQTEKGRAVVRKYTNSEKGKAVARKAWMRFREKKVRQVVEKAVDAGARGGGDLGVDLLDIRILAAMGLGKSSFREIGEFAGLEEYKPQFLAHRVRGLVCRGWVTIEKMPGKGNGAKRLRRLTRSGKLALNRFAWMGKGAGA